MFLWFFFFLHTVASHSWLACVDYNSSLPLNEYNEHNCRAFARDFNHYRSDSFGLDRGYNYRLLPTDPVCKTDYKAESSYNGLYPAPVYTQGEKIRLLWPAKNHVKASCTNQWIPDTQLKLYWMPKHFGLNPTLATVLQDGMVVWDFQSHGTAKGFQQCIDFCTNPDKAICYGDWVFPYEHLPGKGLLVWFWEFNPKEYYSTCVDVTIVGKNVPSIYPSTSSKVPPTTSFASPPPSKQCTIPARLRNSYRALKELQNKNKCILTL